MEKRKLLQAIDKPQQITEVNFRELREMLSEYPYFQTGYLLMAQQVLLHPENTNIKQVLTKCATYAANRTKLHQLLTYNLPVKNKDLNPDIDHSITDNLPDIETKQEKVLPAQSETDEEENVVHFNLTSGLKRSIFKPEDKSENDKTGHLTESPELYLQEEKLQIISDLSNNEEHSKIVNYHELKDDDSESSSLTSDTINIEEEAHKLVDQELHENFLANTNDLNEEFSDTDDFNMAQIEAEAMQMIANDIDRLNEEGALDSTQIIIDDSIKSDSDLISNLKSRLADYLNRNQEQKQDFDPKTDEQTDQILPEKEEMPETKEDEENFLDDSDLPKTKPVFSIEDNYITETMARVYARQENYDRAIAIYESLCIKFPEKKAYFAAKIQEIKNKLT
ncbi:MAG: hypothetical protein IPM47_09295 [Sphingobacteriales bacterium]|nr:MAG: hypothetical protein IPM47_09295 [Sphingobacteriales bacterium]